jgi:CheY-like chemotaxis protein
MSAIVLLAEADPDRRKILRLLLENRGYRVLPASSTFEAACALSDDLVALAIIGWDGQAETGELLRTLAGHHPDVRTLVTLDARVDGAISTVAAYHAAALIDDSRQDPGLVAGRLDRLVGRRVGDLVLRGEVIHDPSGAVFRHPIAARLLSASPSWVSLEGDVRCRSAIHHFRRWLLSCGSVVRVEGMARAGRWRVVELDVSHARRLA